ncbi:MAG: hypothetical protein ACYDAR_03505, partial [Thermomicrobiales bacterium]
SRGDVRAESDQYSLGMVLFEMLTGQTYKRLRKRQAEALLSQQPEQIQTLVRRMIADDPDDRYESMTDVATEIAKIERQLVSAETLPASSRPPIVTREGDVPIDYEPILTASRIPPQNPPTEPAIRRQTPPVNLQPMPAAAAHWQPSPAVPASKAVGRRNIIIASSVLALIVSSVVVFSMLRTTMSPSATATLVTAIPTTAPIPIATPASAPIAIPLTASSTPPISLPTPMSSTSIPQGTVTVSDAFDFCAQVGHSDFRDFDTGPIRFVGTPPVPEFTNNGNTLHYWRCYAGTVLICDRNNGGFSPTCYMLDTSGDPSQNINDYCAKGGTAPFSLYTQGNSNYSWTCNGGKPIRGNQLYSQDELDEFGYVRREWHVLAATDTPTPRIEATATPVPAVAPTTAAPVAVSQSSTSYPGKIVYATANDQMYIIDANGKGQVKVGSGNSPVFSPDGVRVAYVCDANPSASQSPSSLLEICTANLDGSDIRRQCEGGTRAAATGLVRWSPGGRFIAKTTSQNTLGILQLCDLTTGKLQDDLKYRQGDIEDIFDWTPDGNNAIWQSGLYGGVGGNLYYGDPTKFGVDAIQLTNGQNQVSRTDNFYSCARVSPDGKTIAVAGSNLFFLSVPGQHSPLDGRTLTGMGRVERLAWSPDGMALALITIPNPNTWTLTVIDIMSGQMRVITSGATGFMGRQSVDWTRQ